MTQPRWRSKVAWASLLGFVGLVLGNFGLFEKIGLTSETWQTLVNALLGVLVAFGIFNDPTAQDHF